MFKGTTYSFCSATVDFPNDPWCYTTEECINSKLSTLNNEHYIEECTVTDPCNAIKCGEQCKVTTNSNCGWQSDDKTGGSEGTCKTGSHTNTQEESKGVCGPTPTPAPTPAPTLAPTDVPTTPTTTPMPTCEDHSGRKDKCRTFGDGPNWSNCVWDSTDKTCAEIVSTPAPTPAPTPAAVHKHKEAKQTHIFSGKVCKNNGNVLATDVYAVQMKDIRDRWINALSVTYDHTLFPDQIPFTSTEYEYIMLSETDFAKDTRSLKMGNFSYAQAECAAMGAEVASFDTPSELQFALLLMPNNRHSVWNNIPSATATCTSYGINQCNPLYLNGNDDCSAKKRFICKRDY
jgi:hypothetical protein